MGLATVETSGHAPRVYGGRSGRQRPSCPEVCTPGGCASSSRAKPSDRTRGATPRRTCARPPAVSSTPWATCAMGLVVDERCCVLGFENLYVVDASAIPEIPSANTNLTTVALAERAATWL
ncbi:MAG TPA: GMC oxidoreductase [Gaiellaceae bacterium]|nr:GMC oxidoreductase [Gaiellaceae bacterium]